MWRILTVKSCRISFYHNTSVVCRVVPYCFTLELIIIKLSPSAGLAFLRALHVLCYRYVITLLSLKIWSFNSRFWTVTLMRRVTWVQGFGRCCLWCLTRWRMSWSQEVLTVPKYVTVMCTVIRRSMYVPTLFSSYTESNHTVWRH